MSSEGLRNELADIQAKLASAREAAAAPGASERDKADLKLLEQEYLAARRMMYRQRGSNANESEPAKQKKRSTRSSTKP